MEAKYMVCRLCEVTFGFMLNLNVSNPDRVCFHVPYLKDPVKGFTTLEEAIAYRDELIEEKKRKATPDANGRAVIDCSPVVTGYGVMNLEDMTFADGEEEDKEE